MMINLPLRSSLLRYTHPLSQSQWRYHIREERVALRLTGPRATQMRDIPSEGQMAATALSPISPKPSHVPDASVVDFDFHNDPALLAAPHARVLELMRDAPPVFCSLRGSTQ